MRLLKSSITSPYARGLVAAACLALAACGGGSTTPPPQTVAITISPATATLAPSATQQFSASVTGSTNTAANWTVQESSGGAITAAGLYTAPAAAGTFHVVATSAADTSKTSTAIVTVTAPAAAVAVSISPAAANLLTGGAQQFLASVTNSTNTAVTWSVQESAGGSVNSTGHYLAPAAAGTYHVVATSAADATRSATATVVVAAPPASGAVAINPASVSLSTGGTQQFAATIGGVSAGLIWSVQEVAGGSVSSGGLYTAPATVGVFHVVGANPSDTSKSATATVTVTAPVVISISISPSAANVVTGATQQFNASVSGSGNIAVTWAVQELAGGTVSIAGLYTAPAIAGIYHVVATSAADTAKSAAATVTVSAPPAVSVSITPASSTVQVGGTQQFAAAVANSPNQTVNWSVQEGTGGSVSGAGLYTAPGTAGTYHVVATSAADASKSASAAVTVTTAPAVTISISPVTANLLAGATQQFAASASGGASNAVTFSVQEAAGGAVSSTGLYTAPGTAGTYHVTATSVSDSTRSASAAVAVFQTPATPSVSASASCTQVTLTWATSAGAASYAVLRAAHGTNSFVQISSASHAPARSGSQWSFVDADAALTASSTFDYQVVGVNPVAVGAPGPVTAATGIAAPSVKTYAGDTQVSLVWTVPAVFPSGASWIVQRSGGAGSSVQVSPPALTAISMTDISAAVSTPYTYSVYAIQGSTPGCVGAGLATTGSGSSAITQATAARFTSISGNGSGGVTETTSANSLQDFAAYAVSFDGSGTPTGHQGAGTADGYFTLPGVPAGRNFVRMGSYRAYTTLRQLDASFVSNSRAGLAYTSLETDVTINATGLAPFTTGDTLELTALGTGFNNDLITGAKSGAPAASATSVSVVNDFNANFSALLDATKGDTLYLTNVANVSGAATPYAALQRYCPASLTPATLVSGQAATIGCAGGAAMQVPAPTNVNLDFRTSQFAAAALAGAGAGATLLDTTFQIFAFQQVSKYGSQFFGPTILSMDLATTRADVAESVSFANPLPATFGILIQPSSTAAVPLTAAATTACTTPAAGSLEVANFSYDDASHLSSAVAPLVLPVSGVQLLAGAAATDAIFGTGMPVTVSWTAPASGNTPTAYRVFVFSVDADANCKTSTTLETSVWSFGSALSLVIPPRLFQSNDGTHRYAVLVRSYWWDNATDPSKMYLLFAGSRRGTAEAFGGTLLH